LPRISSGVDSARTRGLAQWNTDPIENYRDVRDKWIGTGVQRVIEQSLQNVATGLRGSGFAQCWGVVHGSDRARKAGRGDGKGPSSSAA
jgi:hypothetical protein